MLFFGLKSCDTCRKALKDLRSSGVEPEVVDVRADGLTADHIDRILREFGAAAINRSSATWRGMDDDTRAKPPADLLAEHPTLLKRPVIFDRTATIGWKEDARTAHLGKAD